MQFLYQIGSKALDFSKSIGLNFANWSGLAKIASTLGGGAATLLGGPILGLVMKFLNSTKAKFVKKFVIDNYLNFLKATAGPWGVVAIDILSAYLHEVARNYDQGLGWRSLKTNITNWFPTDKFKQWMPQHIQSGIQGTAEFFRQKGKQQGGFMKYFSGVKTKKVLSNGQYEELQDNKESLDEFIEDKNQYMDKIHHQNLSVTSPTAWMNWWNGTAKSRQQVQKIGNNYVKKYIKKKKGEIQQQEEQHPKKKTQEQKDQQFQQSKNKLLDQMNQNKQKGGWLSNMVSIF